ncbi:MAG: hypothetical protein ACRDYA_01420 [Egibacteraceae bacterium]
MPVYVGKWAACRVGVGGGCRAQLRAANPATAQRTRLEREPARTATAITRLLSLDELRARMPVLRKKQAGLRAQLDALDAHLVDHATYLELAEDLDSFLSRLREGIDQADDDTRHRVLRALVRDVLVGPDRIVIRHSIPFCLTPPTPDCHLRWRSRIAFAVQRLSPPVGPVWAERGVGVLVRYADFCRVQQKSAESRLRFAALPRPP